jgi:hypothetical protein
MSVSGSRLTESRIERLESLLGREWVESQLAEYDSFRVQYSPANLWAHRHPTTSPIIPLLFQYHYPDPAWRESVPYGYWYGEPVNMLGQIADAIHSFEDYWSKIPGQLLSEQLRHKVSSGEQLNGFVFEMLVAEDVRQRYGGYDFHPVFFDPATPKGEPEIVLRKGSQEIHVHSRLRSLLSLLDMSFDLFQYLFGRFYRFVHDSRYSYKLSLNLKQRLDLTYVDALLNQIGSAIGDGSESLREGSSLYDVELVRLELPMGGLTSAGVNGMLAKDAGDLFVQIGASSPGADKNASRIATLSVSSSRYKSLEECMIDVARQAAIGARPRDTHIVAVHLLRYAGWGDYLRNAANRVRLRQGLDGLLKEHANLRYVHVSSNRPEFVVLPSDAQRIDTQHLEVSNRYFEDKPKPKLYIRKDSLAVYPYPEDDNDEQEGDDEGGGTSSA